MFNKFFPSKIVYDIMYSQRGSIDDKIIRRMRYAGCIPKATNTLSEYIIFIAFTLQQLLHERASVLCSTYIVCFILNRSRQMLRQCVT